MMKLLFTTLLFMAGHAMAQDSVKLSGRVKEPLSDSIIVSYNANNIAYYPQEFYAHINKLSYFSCTIPVPHGRYIQAELSNGNKLAELILYSGDSLVINVDAKHFDSTIHYTGKGSAVENFVAWHTLEMGRMNQYSLKIRTDINKEPADFLKSIDEEKEKEMDFLDKNKKGLPPYFLKYWTAFYQFYNYFFMEQYPQIHEMVKLKRYTDTIPEANYVVARKIPYAFNDTFLQLPPYLLYLTGVFDIQLKAKGYTVFNKDSMKLRLLQDSVRTLAYKLLPDESAEYFAAQELYGRAKNQPLINTEAQLNKFKLRWPQSEYLSLLQKQVAMAETLAPGRPAPDFNITTADGKTIKLSELKGKVVYLHFWAAWNRQSIGELLAEKKIKTLIKDKPLEFVYVSIDEDTTIPAALIKKYKLEGLYTYAKGNWNAPELQAYGVQSLPVYFLIDEDGNFAMQNTPDPMQSIELILAIEKLFK